jgi:MFS transporter, OFA family, oxalate/formate antiporter
MSEHQIILRNRWIPVAACVVIQFCLGTAYIWSVFQTGIANKLFGGNNAAAALTFSLLLGVLTFGSTIGGRMQDKTSPRPVIMIGGAMLGLGFILSSFSTPAAPWLLWLTYGVLGGFGMGMIYSTLIACCQKWFPDKRGLITGIIVSALGFGGVIFTPIARALIVRFGERGELQTFFWLGVIFLVVTILGALFVENPPAGFKPAGWSGPVANRRNVVHHQDFKPSQMVKTRQFYLVTLSLLLACMSGLMMIGFASPIAVAKGLTVEVAAVGVMIIAIFNSIGRVFWGYVSDKLGRKNTILILLGATAVSSLFVSAVPGLMIFVLIGIMGFAYGGFLGVFPALTADFWGPRNMGVNYGIVLLGFGVGAIASSYIAGYYRNLANMVEVVDGVNKVVGTDLSKMQPAFIIASAAAVLGIVFMFLLKPPALQEVEEE